MSNNVTAANSVTYLIGVLQQKVDKLPEPMARYEIECAIRYFAQAGLLTCEIECDLQDGCADVHFDHKVPKGYYAQRLSLIKVCDRCIDPIDPCSPCPTGYKVHTPTHITLYPTPCTGQDLKATVCLVPNGELCDLPQDFAARHHHELIDRALAELYGYAEHPWSDLRRSRFHLRRAQSSRTNASIMAARDYVAEPITNNGSQVL